MRAIEGHRDIILRSTYFLADFFAQIFEKIFEASYFF
jgi:hypothetical protein